MYKHEKAVRYLNDNKMDPTILLGMIYGLFQNENIKTEEELEYLYSMVDPEEEYNDVVYYWWDLPSRKIDFFSEIDEFPDAFDDDVFWDGDEFHSFDEEFIECLADLFSMVDGGFVHTGTYEEDDGTGYTGMSYIRFD